jgi:Ribophorin I
MVFINRYINLPASITLSEDQRLQYADTKFIVSPYAIQSQESTYRSAKFMYPCGNAANTIRTERRRDWDRSTSAAKRQLPSIL